MSNESFHPLLGHEHAEACRRAGPAYAETQPGRNVTSGGGGPDEARGAEQAAPPRRRRRHAVRWRRTPRRGRPLPGAPGWLEALIAALVATLISLVVLAATGVFWVWGSSYTLQGIEQGLQWLARERDLPQLLSWWQHLGPSRWVVPVAFSCSEMIWAPIRRFLPKVQGPALVAVALFSAADVFTTHLGLTIRQPWRLLGTLGLTFLPEAAGLWALQFMAEGWLHLWEARPHASEA